MHTKTMQSRRHRLFIAVPCFALVVAASLAAGAGDMPLQASLPEDGLLVADSSYEDYGLQNGNAVRLMQRGRLSLSGGTLRLEEGSVLFHAWSRLDVRVGEWTISAWSSAVDVQFSGSRVMVAAINGPVLVRRGETVLLLPSRTQTTLRDSYLRFDRAAIGPWADERKTIPLPEHYLRDALADIRSLEKWVTRDLATDALEPPRLPIGFLRLNAAQKRLEGEQTQEVLRDIEHAAGMKDPSQLQKILASPDAMQVLSTRADKTTRARILARAAVNGRAAMFMPAFLQGNEEWLLASAHPLLREYVWVLPLPADVSEEIRILRLLLLPAGDHEPEPVSDAAADMWADEFAALFSSDDTREQTAQLIKPLAGYIDRLRTQGFPERAHRYASRIVSVLTIDPERLSSPDALKALIVIRESVGDESPPILTPQSLEVAASSASSVAASSSSLSGTDVERIEGEVRMVLQAAGFMFTTHTDMTVRPPAIVDVREIVLGTPKGDRALRFTYDLAENAVSNIEHEGEILPYSLPLAEYLKWVRGE